MRSLNPPSGIFLGIESSERQRIGFSDNVDRHSCVKAPVCQKRSSFARNGQRRIAAGKYQFLLIGPLILGLFFIVTFWTGAISWSETNIFVIHYVYQFRKCSNTKQIYYLSTTNIMVATRHISRWLLASFPNHT